MPDSNWTNLLNSISASLVQSIVIFSYSHCILITTRLLCQSIGLSSHWFGDMISLLLNTIRTNEGIHLIKDDSMSETTLTQSGSSNDSAERSNVQRTSIRSTNLITMGTRHLAFRGIKYFTSVACFICFLSMLTVQSLQAQGNGIMLGNGGSGMGLTSSGGSSYYDMSLGSGLTIPVNLWGFVKNPGRYVVSSSTNLVQLLSYGGGPTELARITDVRIIRDRKVDSTIKELVLLCNLEQFQKLGDASQNPMLYPGDTIIVPGNAISSFQTTLGIVRDIALVLQVAATIIILSRSR
jgi:polysaccharide biosynthesis/export protein